MAVPLTLSTVPAQTPYVQYVASSLQTVFPYPFEITQDADLVVITGTTTLNTDQGYTVSGQGNNTGGNITFAVGLVVGTIVTIYRNVQIARITQLAQNGTFFATNFNNEFNRIYLILQQLFQADTFALQIPNTNAGLGAGQTTLTAAAYANKYLAFDSNGNPVPAALTSSGSLTGAIVAALLTAPILETLLTTTILGTVQNPGPTAAETALSITPLNLAYPEGDFLRYITSWASNQADTASANTNALNNATLVCAYSKKILVLPAGNINITAAWNCANTTGAVTTTNGGLTVKGKGVGNSSITFVGGANNTGNAWELVGAAYCWFEGFTFVAGSGLTNCPQVMLLMGSGYINPNRLYSVAITFQNVQFAHYGDFGIWNAGAEQIHFHDCIMQEFRHGDAYPSAAPFVFVAAGSAPGVATAFGIFPAAVVSMTDVCWDGTFGAIVMQGNQCVLFHFTATGAAADIRINGYVQTNTPAGQTFTFMLDDSNGAYVSIINNCGGEQMILENGAANGAIRMCAFECTLPKGIRFIGHAASGTTVSAAPFAFAAASIPTDCYFDWDPNESGGFSAGDIVVCAGAENGIFVRAPVPSVNLAAVVSTRTIDAYPGVGVAGNGSDYGTFMTSNLTQGLVTASVVNRTRTTRAGNRTSVLSDMIEGIQTTAAVTTSPVVIATIPGVAAMIHVTGSAVGGQKFYDIIAVMYGGGTPVLIAGQGTGTPGTRTYAIAASNTVTLTMSALTYAVQATVIGVGMQA